MQNWPIASLFNFFSNSLCNYYKQNGLQLFVLKVFERILGLDSGNSSSKINSKSYLNVGVPENQRNFKLEIFGQSLKL